MTLEEELKVVNEGVKKSFISWDGPQCQMKEILTERLGYELSRSAIYKMALRNGKDEILKMRREQWSVSISRGSP